MKKVLAFNGSPRGKRGNTDKILQPFLDGVRETGAEAETLYLKDLNIHECLGCYACHMRTPGKCVIRDDMDWIVEKMLAADMLVFATPLYVFSVSALLKTMLDRMMILGDLKLIYVDGLMVHPPRYPDKKWDWVLISNAGFPEQEHFSALEDMFNRFARAVGGGGYVRMAGSILKGMGELFAAKPLLPGFQWFFDACRKAGSEIVLQGSISAETQKILDTPLMDIPLEEFARISNHFIDKATQKARGGA